MNLHCLNSRMCMMGANRYHRSCCHMERLFALAVGSKFHLVHCVHHHFHHHVDISPSSKPDRALSALNSGLTPNCNLSQSPHGRTPIAYAHTTGNSNTYLSWVSYRNLLRSHYKQGCNQCEHSYTQVYQHLNAHQLHLNAPYKHLSVSVLTSPVEHTN
jgi:hypothetical protein